MLLVSWIETGSEIERADADEIDFDGVFLFSLN
jgi:hypothetical protein